MIFALISMSISNDVGIRCRVNINVNARNYLPSDQYETMARVKEYLGPYVGLCRVVPVGCLGPYTPRPYGTTKSATDHAAQSTTGQEHE